MKESPREVERIRRVRQLWLERFPEDQRTGMNVMAFDIWLRQNRPDLLSKRHGDSYQHLKTDLSGLWNEPSPAPLPNVNRSFHVILREEGVAPQVVAFPHDVSEVFIVQTFKLDGYDILNFRRTDTPSDPKHIAIIELSVRRQEKTKGSK